RSGAPPCAYQLSRNRPRTRRTGGEGGTGSPRSAPLFGLAPQGVCRASSVAGRAVRSYRTVSPLPDLRRGPAVCSLFHFPSRRRASPLASLLPVGARTFLSAPARRPREATAWSSPALGDCNPKRGRVVPPVQSVLASSSVRSLRRDAPAFVDSVNAR